MKKYYFISFIFIIIGLFLPTNLKAQNTPPTFTTTPITTVNGNETYTYGIAIADVDGDELTVTAPTLPFWLTLKTNKTGLFFAGSTQGFTDGTGTTAQFNSPGGIAVDASGNLYVADFGNNKIRKITRDSIVTTFAGSTQGFADGTGTAAQFNGPSGITIDNSGNLYVTENHRIRKITPAGVVTTLAGSNAGYWDATGTAAQFNSPVGIAVDNSGNIYVADFYNNKIRKITPTGVVTTLAGSTQGFTDGTGTAAQFYGPIGIAVDGSGNLYVGDKFNNAIRKITPTGVVTTLAGNSSGFGIDTFNGPSGLDIDTSGNIYVVNYGSGMIKKITQAGVVTSFFGPYLDSVLNNGWTSTLAQFNYPVDLAIDAFGNFYVVDQGYQRIIKITQVVLYGNAAGHVGIHHVVLNVNDGNGGSTDQTFIITVNATLGIDKNIIKGFALYPNPVNNVLNIQAQENINKVKIFNLLGQELIQKNVNNNKILLDVSSLPQGTYFIIVTTDKTIKSVKFIKQ